MTVKPFQFWLAGMIGLGASVWALWGRILSTLVMSMVALVTAVVVHWHGVRKADAMLRILPKLEFGYRTDCSSCRGAFDICNARVDCPARIARTVMACRKRSTIA